MNMHAISNQSSRQAEGSSRRGFLGVLGSALGAVGIVGALEAAPVAAPSATAPAGAGNLQLQDLDRQLRHLLEERTEAEKRRQEARERFWRLCPPRPRELYATYPATGYGAAYVVRELNLGPALQNRRPGAENRLVYDVEKLAAHRSLYAHGSPRARWIEKRLALAERFEQAAEAALDQSGYRAAEAREEAIYRQIERLGQLILSIEPNDLCGVMAHARAISAIAERGHSGQWVYFGEPAPQLVRALLRLPLQV